MRLVKHLPGPQQKHTDICSRDSVFFGGGGEGRLGLGMQCCVDMHFVKHLTRAEIDNRWPMRWGLAGVGEVEGEAGRLR